MVDFPSAVAVPPTSAYGPKPQDFSWLANLPNDYYQGKKNRFEDQQNQQRQQVQKALQQADLQPNDPNYYAKIRQIFAEKGDINDVMKVAPFVQVESTGQVNPVTAQLLGLSPQGGAQPGANAPQPQPQPGPQNVPASVPARPTMPAAGGGDQQGSLADVVGKTVPDPNVAGPAIAGITDTFKKDNPNFNPNAPLTAGQLRRVNGLLPKYAQAAAPAQAPGGRVADAFAALPPSAGNVSAPAQRQPPQAPQPQQAQPQMPPQGAPQGQPQPQQRQPMPPPQPAPQAQPQQQPLVPQVPLPQGFRPGQEQQAILALDRAMVGERNPQARAALQDWRDRIAESTKLIPVHGGETLLNAAGQPVFQGAPTNPTAVALQRFLEENQNATPEQIQAFVQSGRSGRSAIAMYMNSYMQDYEQKHGHPPSPDEIKTAAQTYTTQTTAQNRFMSGPQGNTIRSLNVVVSHLQTMQDLGDALGNGNIKAFNALSQRWAEETGNPAPTNFDTAKQIVGAEVIKALGVAGAGSQAERQEAADAFNRARSPAQLAGAISAARKLLVGQLGGLRRQFITATGLPGEKFDQMLEPQTQAFFGSGETTKTETAAPGGGRVVKYELKPDGSYGPVQ